MAVLLASEQAHSGAGHGEGAPCEARLACEPTLSLQECRYDFPRKEMKKKSTYLLKYWIKMKKKKKNQTCSNVVFGYLFPDPTNPLLRLGHILRSLLCCSLVLPTQHESNH